MAQYWSILVFWMAAASLGLGATRQSGSVEDLNVGIVADPVSSERPPQAGFPELPVVQVAPVPGFDDEAAFLASIDAEVQEWIAQAEAADKPEQAAALQLAAANLLLARYLEAPCTRRLLEIPPPDPSRPGGTHPTIQYSNEALSREVLQRADALLAAVAATLQSSEDEEESSPDESAGRDTAGALSYPANARRRLDVLRAFAAALRTFLVPAEGDPGMEELRQAAALLAPLLEDRDVEIAAAANLWHACLRRRGGDTARTLSALEPAVADPLQGTLPYAFFARLLRCRLLVERGGYPTPLALLAQIEERSNEWFTKGPERRQAVAATRFVRLQVLNGWYDALATNQHPAERQWCVDRATDLISESFGAEDRAVLRLSPTIPIVAPPPGPSRPASGPSGASQSGGS